jgi:hypothetical protein
MNELFFMGGRLVGILGVVVCIVAIVLRLLGYFSVLGFSTGALLQAGMAGVLIGCFLLLLAPARTR